MDMPYGMAPTYTYQDASDRARQWSHGRQLSTLKLVFDTFLFGINIHFGWVATMVRNGLKYLLLGGAALPRVLCSVLQPSPPMGT